MTLEPERGPLLSISRIIEMSSSHCILSMSFIDEFGLQMNDLLIAIIHQCFVRATRLASQVATAVAVRLRRVWLRVYSFGLTLCLNMCVVYEREGQRRTQGTSFSAIILWRATTPHLHVTSWSRTSVSDQILEAQSISSEARHLRFSRRALTFACKSKCLLTFLCNCNQI